MLQNVAYFQILTYLYSISQWSGWGKNGSLPTLMDKLSGLFGTIQLNGSVNDPICYVQLAALPTPGTLLAVGDTDPTYYRVINSLLIVKPLTEMNLAAMAERIEAGGDRYETLSDKCIVFVEPYDPEAGFAAT